MTPANLYVEKLAKLVETGEEGTRSLRHRHSKGKVVDFDICLEAAGYLK